jgi:hypothetical protein
MWLNLTTLEGFQANLDWLYYRATNEYDNVYDGVSNGEMPLLIFIV